MHASGLTATAMQGYPRITMISIPTSHAALVSTCHGSQRWAICSLVRRKGNMETKGLCAWKEKGREVKMRHVVDARRARRTSVKNKEVWDGVLWTSKKLRFC